MSWTLTLRRRAQNDLRRAHDYYEERRPGLGGEFLADMTEALLRLEASPERFPVYYRDFRRVLTRRFPYKIFFRIIGGQIIVFRVLHGAQDHPDKLP
ncbi:MAG: type II toxin-antitoxin system RelE/ParE family toxin [Terrimicrobiaceae bacterium]|nr:type II toxin-antitoxin system RelE/ParE family toxin [Terrimicrobiaceae bacterium]